MAGRRSRWGYRVKFTQAVRLAGSEEALKARTGKARSQLSNWRLRGVPSAIVLKILLERLESGELRLPEDPNVALQTLIPKPLYRTYLDLSDLYRENPSRVAAVSTMVKSLRGK